MNDFRTIKTSGYGEIVEKKSRFLGEVHHVETEAEAEALIAAAKKKYYDARHHCVAYLLGEAGSAQEITKASDDGEPGGSAGRPMLDVLMGAELHQSIAIVTRYFGGTLLGTGGLVRAYSAAVKAALEQAEIVTRMAGEELAIRASYSDAGKLEYFLTEEKLTIVSKEYTETVLLSALVPAADVARVMAQVTEKTDGRAVIENRTAVVFDCV